MKPAHKQLLLFSLALVALIAVISVTFRLVYEPQLALRAMQRAPKIDPFEIERLIRLANVGRLDLTDTLRLTLLLENTGRTDSALVIFKNLAERYPSAPVISLWYAERLQKYGQWPAAEKQYLALLEKIGKNNGLPERPRRFWRAREQELAVAQRAVQIPDRLTFVTREYIYRQLAENAMTAGIADTGEARQAWLEKSKLFFIECLDLAPADHGVRGTYANLLLQMQLPAESLAQYQLLLKTESHNPGWLFSAALAAGADRRFDLAERYMRDALHIENRPEWRLELARFMSWGGKHEAALNEIAALIEEQPDNPALRREQADLLLNAGRHADYLSATARLVATEPLNLDLRLKRLRAMLGQSRYQDAANEAAALLALFPDNHEAAILRAEALLWHGEYRAAQADLLALTQQTPDDPLARKRLAQSYLWDKRWEQALRIFQELNPASLNDIEVAIGYAEAVAGRQSPSSADAELIRGMRQNIISRPETDWPLPLLMAMGRALREIGEKDAAVELLGSAAQRAQTNLQLRLELADLLQSIGRYDEAGREYQAIFNAKKQPDPGKPQLLNSTKPE